MVVDLAASRGGAGVAVDLDLLWPRDEEHRYRIYVVREDGEPHMLAATATAEGIGLTLVTLHEEGQIDDRTPVGILDGLAVKGGWIVNPWARPRR